MRKQTKLIGALKRQRLGVLTEEEICGFWKSQAPKLGRGVDREELRVGEKSNEGRLQLLG